MIAKIKKNYFLIISALLVIYFVFNLMNGDRGLFSYFKKKDQLEELIKKEKIFISNNKDLRLKISLLTDNLDLDFIETLIRDKFMFGKKNEKHYIINNNEN